ncbi:hypothetical protein [Ferrovibrio terrae]|uniref:hypothetical protein n=1 Tax=Ferrovibrio terrae TaxID=2594003 RepID=UPI003137CD3F
MPGKNFLFVAFAGLAIFFHAGPTSARNLCAGIWQKSLSAGKQLRERAGLVNEPGTRIYEHMQKQSWHIVWADFENAESGASFIKIVNKQPQKVESWGGVAIKGDEREIYNWAMKLDSSFPPSLAKCFAWYVVEGRYMAAPTRPNPFNTP